jgi:methyl-accepting chemotaxis protein
MEEQAAATKEISRNVQKAAGSAKLVSENISGVSAAVKATGQASFGLLLESEKLADQAGTLQAEVHSFLATVRAA